MKYSIDTSAILEGWHRQFPPDIAPGFWEGFDELIESGSLKASEEVLFELEKKDDEIFKWAKKKEEFFVQIDVPVQRVVRDILIDFPTLIDSRRNRSGADPFVIALARLTSSIVVTYENPTNSIRRPHIPDVCNAYKIRVMNLLDLIRNEGWQFHI